MKKEVFNSFIDLNIWKADQSHGGKLVLVHIVDKKGHHRVVWKKKEEVNKEKTELEHKHVSEVESGQTVYYKGEKHKIHKIKNESYITIVSESGKKDDRSINKLQFVNPTGETNEEQPTPSIVENKKEVKPKEDRQRDRNVVVNDSGETDDDEPLNYDLYGSPTERAKDWEKLIKNFAEGRSRNLTISYGTGGVGKTYSVINNAKIKNGLETGEVVKFTGGTTPGGFFEMLYKNRDKKIILDDFDMVFKEPGMLALITTLSRNTGKIILTNPTSGNIHGSTEDSDRIPNKFEFNGKLMIISNINLENKAVGGRDSADKFDTLLTNSDRVNLKLSRKETWDLMNEKILHDSREMVNGEANSNFGKLNPNLKFQDAYGTPVVITDKQKQELVDYFSERWDKMAELSGRTLTKANAIREFYTTKGEDWKFFADAMLLKDGPTLDINKRFDVFNDSLEMIRNGQLKSAVIADKDAESIKEYYDDEDLKESPLNGGFEMVDQMNPDYIPVDGEVPVNEQFVTITGKDLTEKALYETLWKQNGKIIVFDKTAKLFLKSDLGQGLLKGALDTSGDGEVCWLSSVNTGKKKPSYKKSDFENGKAYQEQLKLDGYNFETDEEGNVDQGTISHPHDLPDKFAFKGRCIFVVNDTEDAPQPIQSRSMLADVVTNPDEFITRAKYVADHRERKNKSFSKVFEGVTSKEYREAIKVLEDNRQDIHTRYFSEEGLQKIIRLNREEYDSPEKKMRTLKRELIKSNPSIQFAGVKLDLNKAFADLV